MKISLKLAVIVLMITLLGVVVFLSISPKTLENKDFSSTTPVYPLPEPAPEQKPSVPVVEEEGDQTFILGVGERAPLSSGYMVITDVFADSRCPVSVQCIWAGEVKIGLRYVSNTASPDQDVILTYPKVSPTFVGGYNVSISSVSPEKTQDIISKKRYEFQIFVGRAESQKAASSDGAR